MAFLVYVVECADGTYYTGWTTNLDRRLREHNVSKNGSRYTRARRPVALRYVEECTSRSAALKRESAIKTLSRQDKEALWAPQNDPEGPTKPLGRT